MNFISPLPIQYLHEYDPIQAENMIKHVPIIICELFQLIMHPCFVCVTFAVVFYESVYIVKELFAESFFDLLFCGRDHFVSVLGDSFFGDFFFF